MTVTLPVLAEPRGLRCLVLAALAALSAGCRNPAEADLNTCQQTYEFGNSGCLEVSGEVVTRTNRPLPGFGVAAHALMPDAGLAGTYDVTDANGHFHLRLMRMFLLRAPPSVPDTVSVYVVSADMGGNSIDLRLSVRDSVLVAATIAPIGQIPTASHVRLVLPLP